MALQPGDLILNGKYQIVELLAEGGMAHVWLAYEITFGRRQVVIKEPRSDLLPDLLQEVRWRYAQETQLCAELEKAHVPCIVRALTAEPYGDGLLLVLEYMPGGDLATLLQQNRAGLPLDQAVTICLDLLRALDGVHSHPWEVVHRDIKPSNILFNGSGRAHLGDFGLAQIAGISGRSQLRGGVHPGTYLYMAPEQASRDAPLKPAADLYALGCVLFEMATGKRYKRFRPSTRASEIKPGLPSWLDELLVRVLDEDPWARHQTALDLAADLQAGLQREVEAREDARRHEEEQARQAETARLLEQAQEALASGSWQKVSRCCDELARLEPAHPDLGRLRAQALAGQREEQEAAERARARRAELERLYSAARGALEIGDWAAALASLDPLLSLDAGYADAAALRAHATRELQARQEALERERQRMKEVQELYGQLLAKEKDGNWAGAVDVGRRLEAEQPGYRDAASRLDAAQKQLEAQKAAQERKRQREEKLVADYRALCELELKGDWAGSVEAARQLEAAEPGYRDVPYRLRQAEKTLDAQRRVALRRQKEEARRRQKEQQRQQEPEAAGRRRLPIWAWLAGGAALLLLVAGMAWLLSVGLAEGRRATATPTPSPTALPTSQLGPAATAKPRWTASPTAGLLRTAQSPAPSHTETQTPTRTGTAGTGASRTPTRAVITPTGTRTIPATGTPTPSKTATRPATPSRTPTRTPVPPTNTALPPTNTSIPPSDTPPPPPTNTSVPPTDTPPPPPTKTPPPQPTATSGQPTRGPTPTPP